MKIKLTMMFVLAVLVLAACSNEETNHDGNSPGLIDVAYLSINIEKQRNLTRSGEDDGEAVESDLVTLYLMTFDTNGKILQIPGENRYFNQIGSSITPDAFKVAAESKTLLVIANPGTKLETVIRNTNATSHFSSINAAISAVNIGEIMDSSKGFTMINSGDETGLTPNQTISNPLIDISGNIKKAADYSSEAAAKAAAEADRSNIKIERLSSKLELKLKSSIAVSPAGATFTFGNWTLDRINTTFYPFAEKTILSVSHTLGSYIYNFYTKDPNFENMAGIEAATISTTDYSPILVAPYTWMAANAKTYSIENTMAAAQQKFGNATRIIIKGTYYPETGWTGDWFNYYGTNYKTLADLQNAYSLTDPTPGISPLRVACDKMYTSIATYANTNSITLTGTDFETLTVGDLAQIPNGGEVIKDGANDVIRWYQDGLNYYYYQIRHDDVTTQEMAFGKYGVVRNNWYSLTLGSVGGAGTPWYPDVDNPGPGEPEPGTDIDESVGFLGIEIEIAPWIIWEREINI